MNKARPFLSASAGRKTSGHVSFIDRCIFIQNQKVQSVAAQRIVVFGASQADCSAGDQFDSQVCLVRSCIAQ